MQASTAYIERLNLTLQRSLAYFARRSPSHANSDNRLVEHLELAGCYYKFIRQHAGLRFGQCLRTPVMVAGLSDRVLGFRDVVVTACTNT